MMLMDFMGVSVALPEVRRALGGSFSEMQWVLEAFVLTLAAFVLTAGYVADLAGRRTIFLLGLAVLALGSLL
jgi:MFS family permease